MLSPADGDLVRRDPALPGLPVLLDDDRLDEWVRATLGVRVRACRRYLRYKPGTSCVLGIELSTPDGAQPCLVTAYGGSTAAKLHKTVGSAPRGAVLGVDTSALLVATTAAADRDLPALRTLARPKRRKRLLRSLLPEHADLDDRMLQNARVTPLSYKPQRRWVGLLVVPGQPSRVLRAYRPVVATAAAAGIQALSGGSPATPRLLGLDPAAALVAVEYLPGRSLQEMAATGVAGHPAVAAAGAALAVLHERTPPPGLAGAPGAQEAALRAAVDQLATLLPGAAERTRALGDELAGLLGSFPVEQRPLHGDFSADQVVIGPDGAVSFIDLDRAGLGDPAVDLATATAAWAMEAALTGMPPGPAEVVEVLHTGYAKVRPLPCPRRLAVHTSAMLLRRAVEPFRSCRPEWPVIAQRLVDEAANALVDALPPVPAP